MWNVNRSAGSSVLGHLPLSSPSPPWLVNLMKLCVTLEHHETVARVSRKKQTGQAPPKVDGNVTH